MIKFNNLAVIAPALLVAGVVNAVEVYNKDGNKLDMYGRAVGLYYFSNDRLNDGDRTYVRFGFKGQTQINEKVAGFGQWEYNVQGNKSEGGLDVREGTKTRLGFAGLNFFKYGTLRLGRDYGLVYSTLGVTDVMFEYGGDSAISDNYMNGRSTGLLTYSTTNFFDTIEGLDFAIQYQAKNERGDGKEGEAIRHSNGEGWSTSASYVSPTGLGVYASYSASNRTLLQKKGEYRYNDDRNVYISGTGDKAEALAAGIKYDANNIYLAAVVGQTHNLSPFIGYYSPVAGGVKETIRGVANKAEIFEVVAQYNIEMGGKSSLRPSLGYVQSRGKDIEDFSKAGHYVNADLHKYVEVGVAYFFNPNISAYVDYRINQINKENPLNLPSGDIVATGLSYQF